MKKHKLSLHHRYHYYHHFLLCRHHLDDETFAISYTTQTVLKILEYKVHLQKNTNNWHVRIRWVYKLCHKLCQD